MWIGESQHDSQKKTLKEGCLAPLTNRDPETRADNPKQGQPQKLRSATVPLFYVLVGAAILVTLIIILAALYGTALRGNDKDPTSLERSTAEVLLMPTQKLVTIYIQCENGWILYRGKCYYLSDNLDTWTNSQKFCQLHNSSLATIDNGVEYKMLNRIKGGSNHWIGLSRTGDNSGWVWTNGTPYLENLFKIDSLFLDPSELACAFLNHDGVKSGSEKNVKRWICSKHLIWQA